MKITVGDKNIPIEVLSDYLYQFFDLSLKHFPESYLSEEQISYIDQRPHKIYICPFCVKNYYFTQPYGGEFSAPFSEDHFPPKSVGGSMKILLCKTCNSEAGHNYDYILKEHMDEVSFSKNIPNSKRQVRIKIPGNNSSFKGAKLTVGQGHYTLYDRKNPNDKILPLDNHKISMDKEGKTMDILLPIHDEKIINQALLHAAYLYCFECFGYDFIFSHSGENLRSIINGEKEYPMNLSLLNLDSDEHLSVLQEGVHYIHSPENLKSYCVVVKLINKETNYTALKIVLIPSSNDINLDDLKNKCDAISKHFIDVSMANVTNVLRRNIPKGFESTMIELENHFNK